MTWITCFWNYWLIKNIWCLHDRQTYRHKDWQHKVDSSYIVIAIENIVILQSISPKVNVTNHPSIQNTWLFSRRYWLVSACKLLAVTLTHCASDTLIRCGALGDYGLPWASLSTWFDTLADRLGYTRTCHDLQLHWRSDIKYCWQSSQVKQL